MKPRRLLLAFTILLVFPGCQSGKDTAVPDRLVGVWKTTTAKYADRFFEITKHAIIFGIGDKNIDLYPIAKIEAASKDRRMFYAISLRTPEGDPHRFAFYYDPLDEGKIQLENQKEITWTKERLNE